jgi:hypothetical protein
MSLRLLPWAFFAAVVAGLAFLAPTPEGAAPAPSEAGGAEAAALDLEVRMGPVDMRELHDDGTWNRLEAKEAVYSYGRKTVDGTGVSVSLGTGKSLDGSVIRAVRAFWDFEGRSIELPEGGRADRKGGWTGELAPASLDLGTRTLRVPGAVSLSGPGLSIVGGNLEWRWPDGKITMDSPVSRITPKSLPGKRG